MTGRARRKIEARKAEAAVTARVTTAPGVSKER
jgi:hypothetical protein